MEGSPVKYDHCLDIFAAARCSQPHLCNNTRLRQRPVGSDPADIRAIIKYTKLDTGVYLDSIKGMEPDDQREKVKADLAEPSIQQDAELRAFNRKTAAVGKPLRDVQLAWSRASAEDRRRIKAWVLEQETPVSDDETDYDRVES